MYTGKTTSIAIPLVDTAVGHPVQRLHLLHSTPNFSVLPYHAMLQTEPMRRGMSEQNAKKLECSKAYNSQSQTCCGLGL